MVSSFSIVPVPGTSLAYTENEGAVAIDDGIGVIDADHTNLSGAEVAVSGGFQEGEDVLAPHTLPGARGLLANRRSRSSVRMDDAEIVHIDGQGRATSILSGGYAPRYVPSGHLVFVQDRRVLAVPFDLDRMMVRGAPLEVLGGVQYEPSSGTAQWAFSVRWAGWNPNPKRCGVRQTSIWSPR